MAFPVIGGTQVSGYEIDNSLRFNQEDDARLSRTPSSAGDRQKFTLSTWVKFCNFNDSSGSQNIFESRPGAYFLIVVTNTNNATGGNTIRIEATGGMDLGIDRFFRDGSAWYHLVFAFDTTQATASDRVKFYVNGEQTGLNSTYTTYPNQNESFSWNNNVIQNVGGSAFSGDENSDFYLADTYNIDGQQLAPTEFGETDDNGVWIPKNYTGSYGTNGFKLEFKQLGTAADADGIGADTSGNDNHFSQTNVTPALDRTTDTPTNNFATLNSLTAGTYPELREGNLQQFEHGSSDSSGVAATMMPINGKWYAELYLNAPSANDYPMLGITDTINLSQKGASGSKMAAGFEMSGNTNNQGTNNLGTITNTNTGWPSFSDNDIVMYALDCDNRKLWLGRNGTWINSGDPAAGSNQQLSWTVDANVCPFLLGYDNSQSGGGGDESIWNYGNPPFSISSGNADANGYGNFEYAVPSGFYSLCTKNLAEYG